MNSFLRNGLFPLLALLLAACSRPEPVSVASLARRLADPLEPARLGRPSAILHSSYDRTGGNDDYGFFLRPSTTPGWRVLAEFKGPGYLSRFWFTGAKAPLPFRFRFYVDGSPDPAFEGDVLEFCSGTVPPFLPPLANYEQFAWFSFLPVPYAKSLRIECQDPPPGAKPYFQFAEMPLPKGTPVESFSWPLSPEALAALDDLRAAWSAPTPLPGNAQTVSFDLRPSANPDDARVRIPGPVLVSRIEFAPDFSALPVAARDAFLRDAWVSFRYGASPFDSVAAPLGDLCGMPWRRADASSRFFGMDGDVLHLDFPVPVPDVLDIRITVPAAARIPVRLSAVLSPLPSEPLGLFHASWRRSTPAELGAPHVVSSLSATSGKFLGCLLSVASLDPSFWVLEGDESIALDSPSPSWLGTGLEDYFNSAWYYRNPLASPTHGLLQKEPFRTVQYRIHLADPPSFSSSFRMAFERGPSHASHAFFESVAWFYLPAPAKIDSMRLPAAARSAPSIPQADLPSLLPALWALERFGDLPHARDLLAARLEAPPSGSRDFPLGSTRGPLRELAEFRLALYDRLIAGEPLEPLLEKYAASPRPSVSSAARILLSEQLSGTLTALLYADMPATVFIDGSPVLSNDPAVADELAAAAALDLPPGPHVVAIRTPVQPYPDWVLLALRRADGFFFSTGPEWHTAFNAPEDAVLPAYDDSAWDLVTPQAVCKGPPEEPHIYVRPDPYILLQSRALPIRPLLDKPPAATSITYRATFTLP